MISRASGNAHHRQAVLLEECPGRIPAIGRQPAGEHDDFGPSPAELSASRSITIGQGPESHRLNHSAKVSSSGAGRPSRPSS